MYIHNNFGSFYFLPLNDMYNIIEHKMSVIAYGHIELLEIISK